MLSAVIFDIDGTLVDSVDLHASCWQEALAKFGHQVPYTRILREIGKGSDQILTSLLPPNEVESVGARVEAFRSERFKTEYLPKVRPFPQTRELFQRLHGDGVRLALASSGKRAEIEHLQDLAGITPYVSVLVTAEDVARTKPAPDIFLAALARLPEASADNTLVVGDTPYDVEAARLAGLRTVALLSGPFDAAALRQAGAVALFEDVGDLLARFTTWAGSVEDEERDARIVRVPASPPSSPH